MSWKSESLKLLEPSGPHRACYGTALPLKGITCDKAIIIFCNILAVNLPQLQVLNPEKYSSLPPISMCGAN
jgi:hypothetical protein